MHLHLPQLVVAHHHNGIMSEGICLHELTDTLVVGPHATADKRDGAGGYIVAPLQLAVFLDTEDGLQAEMLVAECDDISLSRTLT